MRSRLKNLLPSKQTVSGIHRRWRTTWEFVQLKRLGRVFSPQKSDLHDLASSLHHYAGTGLFSQVFRRIDTSISRNIRAPARQLKRHWDLDAYHDASVELLRLFKGHKLPVDKSGQTDFKALSRCINKLLLRSSLNRENVEMMATHAHRIAWYRQDQDRFQHPLSEADVTDLMRDGVPAVCISYKHKRASLEQIHVDRTRVQNVVRGVCRDLGLKEILFWSDVYGKRRKTWVQEGIDPYLTVPTVRVVSKDLAEQIDTSLWMNVELFASKCRGGLLKFDEDRESVIWENATDSMWPNYAAVISESRMELAKKLCSPQLYYLKTLFEGAKFELLKYAMFHMSPEMEKFFSDGKQTQGGEDAKLLSSWTSREIAELVELFYRLAPTSASRDPLYSDISSAKRPIYPEHNAGKCWKGLEELMPAVQILPEDVRAKFNSAGRCLSEVLVLRVDDDSKATILLRLVGGAFREVLRLQVAGYKETADAIEGHVIKYSVGTEKEERLMKGKDLRRKFVAFGECQPCFAQEAEESGDELMRIFRKSRMDVFVPQSVEGGHAEVLVYVRDGPLCDTEWHVHVRCFHERNDAVIGEAAWYRMRNLGRGERPVWLSHSKQMQLCFAIGHHDHESL